MSSQATIRGPSSRRTRFLVLAGFLAAFGLWALLPVIPQDPAFHVFADQRRWLGIPRAADVVSSLAFIAMGVLVALRLAARDRCRFSGAAEASLWSIALGVLCTGFGSAWYHLDPSAAALVWDRLPMTLAFGGVLGLAIAQRLGNDVGGISLAALIALGIASIVYWQTTGDLSLYAVLQFGGFAAVIVLLLLTRKGDDPIPWWWLIVWYAIAKVFELEDQAVWQATSGLVAGHALKHFAAAVAIAGLLRPLRAR